MSAGCRREKGIRAMEQGRRARVEAVEDQRNRNGYGAFELLAKGGCDAVLVECTTRYGIRSVCADNGFLENGSE